MLPNFFVIGANKAGTTALHRYLGQHPDVFMSAVKEPYYFAHEDGVLPDNVRFHRAMEKAATRDAYERLFAGSEQYTAVGESSTGYLPNPIAARRIHEAIPQAKLIAILRDPSDRARSAHAHARRERVEPIRSLRAAIDEELAGCSWRNYVALGRYADGLGHYYERFDREQLKVFLYEEFTGDPAGVVHEIFGWLGVDTGFTPDLARRYNVSNVPRSMAIDRAIHRSGALKSMVKAVVPQAVRRRVRERTIALNRTRPAELDVATRVRLVELFTDDIARTEALIGRDLSRWRAV